MRISHRSLLVSLLAFLLSSALVPLLLTPGVAAAAEEHEEKTFLRGLPGLVEPEGVAFDQVNDAVLVVDIGVSEVKVFPGGGGGAVASLNGREGSQATPQPGGFSFRGNTAIGVAVDGAGNVYVGDNGNGVIDKFKPLGGGAGYEYVCQYSGVGRGCMRNPEVELGSPGTFGEVAGLAVDQAGDLYVADYEGNAVDEFDAAGGDVAQILTGEHPLLGSGPTAVAVDGSGDVFIEDEQHQAVELEHGLLGETLVASEVTGLTFDFDSGLLLLSEIGQVAEYNPVSGSVVSEFHSSNGLPNGSAGGIATHEIPGASTGTVFVIEPGQVLAEYGPPPPLAPAVSGESVGDITSRSALLGGVIEPKLRASSYTFQFGSTQSYGGELPLPPGGNVVGSQASARVEVSVEGLQPGVLYHYRLAATNQDGTTFGPDQTFTTFPLSANALPDNRIWEMVSPLEKNSGAIIGPGEHAFQASGNGEKVTFLSKASFGGAVGNSLATQYLATRGPEGWVTENISPPLKSGSYFPLNNAPYKAFSSDLTQGLLRNGEGLQPPIPNPPLPGTNAPPGYDNFYLRDDLDNSYQALLTTSTAPILPASEFFMSVEGVTPDLKHVVAAFSNFATGHPLVLDEWSEGHLTAVNVPVNPVAEGETVAGAVLGSGNILGTEEAHAISSDGSHVFWSIGGNASNGGGSEPVFVRVDGVRTLQLPAGEFVDASSSGAKVLLSTGEVFDVDGNRRVGDVTGGAGGLVGELGASEDLSKIYFVDTAVLPGAGANSAGQTPRTGENNLYLYREGAAPDFIATLAVTSGGLSADRGDWARGVWERTSRVTADGAHAVFDSTASLTGFDSGGSSEVYWFDAASGALVCVSCNPTGVATGSGASIPAGNTPENFDGLFRAFYDSRVLSGDGGRVFFDSSEGLVAGDTNGVEDVYEFESDGSGSCTLSQGCIALISSGTGGASRFFDASENGDNVFFTTANELVPGDTDQLTDLYDARVDGGFPAGATPPACTGTGCQGVPATPPIFATPSSATFNGVGNFTAGPAAPAVKPKAKTNAQKLAGALKACHAKRGKKRRSCEVAARHKYAPAKKASVKEGGKGRK
jgi:hypothetical protein